MRRPAPLPEQRIAIVGTTGSGKTTLARQLAHRLGIPHIELDALHWEPNWRPAAPDVFRQRTEQTLAVPAWVTDGNYGQVRDIVWGRATTLIWLDFPLPLVFWRLFARTLRRTLTREELWNGNRERFREQFLSRESLFLWAWQTYRRHRREYPRLLRQPHHRHIMLIRLRSSRQTTRWLHHQGL